MIILFHEMISGFTLSIAKFAPSERHHLSFNNLFLTVMKKTFLSFAMAALMVAGLASCGNKSDKAAAGEATAEGEKQQTEQTEEKAEAAPGTYETEFYTYKLTENFKERSVQDGNSVYISTAHMPNISISIAAGKQGDLDFWKKLQTDDKMVAGEDVTGQGYTYSTYYKEGESGYVLRAATIIGLEGATKGYEGRIELQLQGNLADENHKQVGYERLKEIVENITPKKK